MTLWTICTLIYQIRLPIMLNMENSDELNVMRYSPYITDVCVHRKLCNPHFPIILGKIANV